MKNIIKVLLFQVFCINILYAQIDFSKEELQYIENNTVKINLTTSWIPFHYKNKDDKTVGIALDFWKLIANKANIKYEVIEANDFTQVLENIKTKKYDLNIATTKTKNREKYAIFSLAYEKYAIAIATKKDERLIDNTASLNHKKVAVGKNYSSYFLLSEKYPDIDFVFTKNVEEALELLHKGKVFAAIDIEPSLYFQKAKGKLEDIKILRSDVNFELQMMIRDDAKLLQSILNKVIKSISNEEKIEIYKKWLNERQFEDVDYHLLVNMGILFLSIVIIMLIMNIKNKEINRRIALINSDLEEKIDQEIKKNEQQQLMLLRQSRLAQMGEMISMIAHQWRQPLNNLSVINQTLVMKYKRGKLEEKDISNFNTSSNKQIQNMSKVIDDFKNFFKPEKQKSEFEINDIVESAIEILKPVLKKENIKISFGLKDKFEIIGYPNEFRQAIINILTNSIDEFMGKNKIDKEIEINFKRDNYIMNLEIKDNAKGIPEDLLEKIFDPYFSTKSEKNGTGLGLYMTKIIIEDHMHGEIKVSNSKDGAVFTIILKIKDV